MFFNLYRVAEVMQTQLEAEGEQGSIFDEAVSQIGHCGKGRKN